MTTWSLEENEVTIRKGLGVLKVEVRKPIHPPGPPDALVTMWAGGEHLIYMVLTATEWDTLADRLMPLRYQLDDNRPVATCRDITRKNISLFQVDSILQQTYGPAMSEHINMHNAFLKQYLATPPRQCSALRHWLRKPRRHLHLRWGY